MKRLATLVAIALLLAACSTVPVSTTDKTEWVTITAGGETVETDSEPLSSAGRKAEADIAQPCTPESEM